jgi:endonuclease/exonuclease/phosphatase family metal-dependent hydrolase
MFKTSFFIFSAVLFSISMAQANQSLKVVTYNLGLAHTFVPHAKERLPHLVQALKKTDADVLCLQEVWTKKDRKKIIKSLKKKFGHQFTTKIKNVSSKRRPTCKIKELFVEGKFVGCMNKNCKKKEGDDFTDCIINTCGGELESLKNDNRECASSLMAQVGKSTFAGLFTVLNPLKKAGLFTYKGSNGLMLLSKLPLKNKRHFDLTKDSTLNRRGALLANVGIGEKEITIMCAHLSADLSQTAPYTGSYSSWAQENAVQLGKLLSKSEETSDSTILMGDFNCGWENLSQGLEGELENNCNLINGKGFRDSLKEDAPECTFCNENTLNSSDEFNSLIDHIFVRGLKSTQQKVIFKEPVFISTDNGKKEIHLSDHYGVHMEISL